MKITLIVPALTVAELDRLRAELREAPSNTACHTRAFLAAKGKYD